MAYSEDIFGDDDDMEEYSWWEMGNEAFHRGKFIWDNPNSVGTKGHIDWAEGWNHAKYAANIGKDLSSQLDF